jgi:hypothetical protein
MPEGMNLSPQAYPLGDKNFGIKISGDVFSISEKGC